MTRILFHLFFFCVLNLNAQTRISGEIFKLKDSSAVQGVSIYLDGTSIGTTSSASGTFSMESDYEQKAELIIRSIGFETRRITIDPSERNNFKFRVYLKESLDELEEVFLETDPWSRNRKLSIFRRQFLGTTEVAEKTSIKNEEVIKLRYSPSKHTLVAYANEPLIIKNKYLGYEIEYELQNFKVTFYNSPSGLYLAEQVFYEGTMFFKELNQNTPRRYRKNRKTTYEVSLIKFFRSLYKENLQKDGFRIFHKGWETKPYRFFKLFHENDLMRVEILSEKLSVLYEGHQSEIIYHNPFYIDRFGNYYPTTAISVAGAFGLQRISSNLPLDYEP